MSRVDITKVPENSRKYIDKTKLELLQIVSSLEDSNKSLVKKLFVDEESIPSSVKGLTGKTKMELLNIIARKDSIEVEINQKLNDVETKYNQLKANYDSVAYENNDYIHIIKKYENIIVGIIIILAIMLITFAVKHYCLW